MKTYVIVGAGIAGVSAAEAMRGTGFDDRIAIVGEERSQPYQRPPLSKQLLRGEVDADFPVLRAPGFYQSNAIELHLGERVTQIDTDARHVVCASGTRLGYDKLLLATGGSPRQLRVSGGGLSGIHYLRTLEQALEIRRELQRRPHVLIVGSGFIGCEVAASARQMDCRVTMVATGLPMERALGTEVAAIYAGYHRSHGVDLRTGVSVTEFRGMKTVEEAVLSDGSTVPCSLAVVGIGITPSLNTIAGLDTQDGLATDAFCRTEIEDVFAAGDIARSWRPSLKRRVRLEHFTNAQLQGSAAGRAMCGKLEPFDSVPFFWSDQYEFELQYFGNATAWDEVVIQGQAAQGSFRALYLEKERVEAGCLVNRSRESGAVKRLLGKTLSPLENCVR